VARDDATDDRLPSSEVRRAFSEMSNADWARAESIAAFIARGLPGMTWEDLLQEVMTQLMSGQRRYPRGKHPLVVLKTAMRSVANNARTAARSTRVDDRYTVEPIDDLDVGGQDANRLAPAARELRTPEVEALAAERYEAIMAAISGDDAVELVTLAWMDGLRGAAAVEATGLEAKVYDAARKRLVRRLAAFADDGAKP
jgi:hypothetical protein